MTDDDFRALQEQSHHVRELTGHIGWQVLTEFMHERMKSDKLAILNGNVASLDEYKRRSGVLVGIHAVLDAPADLQKMVDDEAVRRAERTASRGDDAA